MINTNIQLSVQVALNPERPGSFLATYKSLLSGVQASRTHSLLNTTTRLLKDYMLAQAELDSVVAKKTSNLVSWIKKRKLINKAKDKMSLIKQKLMSWVSSTLNFFRGSVFQIS